MDASDAKNKKKNKKTEVKTEKEESSRKRQRAGSERPSDPKMPSRVDEQIFFRGCSVRFKGHKWVVRVPRVAAKNGKEFSVDRVVGADKVHTHSFFNQTNTFGYYSLGAYI